MISKPKAPARRKPEPVPEMLVGDLTGGTIEGETRRRRPTRERKRQRQIANWLREEVAKLRKQQPSLKERDLASLAAERLREAEQLDPYTAHALEKVRPALTVRPSSEVDRAVELAAIFRLPVMIWLRLWLQSCSRGPRTRAFRALPTAVGLHMGFGLGRPEIKRWRDIFRRAYAVEAWQHLYPTDSGPADYSAFCKQVKRIFGVARDPRVYAYVNRELVRELAGHLIKHPQRNGTVRTSFFPRPRRLPLLAARRGPGRG